MTLLLPQVITAQMALNYAAFLEEHNFFEDSFRVYEQAVALFGFPQVGYSTCGYFCLVRVRPAAFSEALLGGHAAIKCAICAVVCSVPSVAVQLLTPICVFHGR
jgi:hypothetical protein